MPMEWKNLSSSVEILKWLESTAPMIGNSGLCWPVCHSMSFEYLVDAHESHHATLLPQFLRVRVEMKKTYWGQEMREMSEVGWVQNSGSP